MTDRDRIDILLQRARKRPLEVYELAELRDALNAVTVPTPCACGKVHGEPGTYHTHNGIRYDVDLNGDVVVGIPDAATKHPDGFYEVPLTPEEVDPAEEPMEGDDDEPMEFEEVSNVGPALSGGGPGPARIDPETGRYVSYTYPLPDDPRDLPEDHRTWNDEMIEFSNGEIGAVGSEVFVVVRSAGDYGDYYVEVKAAFNNKPGAEDYAKAGQLVDTAEREWSGGGWRWEVHPTTLRRASYLADQNVDPQDEDEV
jgi:hypothetical protein